MSSFLPVSTRDYPGGCDSGTQVPLQICIASAEFIGTCDPGATGFAYTATAQALALAGHQVTCLFLGERLPSTHEWQRWVEKYRADGLTLIALPPINASELVAPPNLIKSYEAYQWLKRNDRFDIIHFPEREGPGYHTLTAKHHGLAFTKATICVGLHNLTSWMQSPEEKPASAAAEVDTGFMERRAVALADAVVSPTHNLAKWISERSRTMPALESAKQPPVQAKPALLTGINELVYFGTLEARQGLELFCDALDHLPLAVAKKMRAVMFLGQESIICGIPSRNYLQKRSHRWVFPFQIIDGVCEIETMDYLRGKNRLTVIPALRDGSPYRVLECLVAKIAFVASRVGGITELIATEDVSKVCFEPEAGALSEMLTVALSDGISLPRAAVEVGNTEGVSPRLPTEPPEPPSSSGGCPTKTPGTKSENPSAKEKRRHESRPLYAADFTTPFVYF